MAVSKFSDKTKKKKAARRNYRFPSFWSFSRWNVFNQCRQRYEFQFLQKLPQPESIHLERGNKVHKQGEDYLDGTTNRVPTSFKEFAPEMRVIKKIGATAEGNHGFTTSWSSCATDDWSNCWLRVKIDAEIYDEEEADELTQVDFKTGKPWPKDTAEQSEIYAVTGFLRYPDVDTITVEFWYVDSGEVVPYVFTRKQYPALKKKWAARAREMLGARQFPPTTNGYNCKFCPFRSDKKLGNGLPGPCDDYKKAK